MRANIAVMLMMHDITQKVQMGTFVSALCFEEKGKLGCATEIVCVRQKLLTNSPESSTSLTFRLKNPVLPDQKPMNQHVTVYDAYFITTPRVQ